MTAYTYASSSRSPAAMIAISAWLAGLAALWVVLDAAAWIVLLLALPVLPALWDLCTNSTAHLTLTADRIDWTAGRSTGGIEISEIGHVRMDTRWDFSVRVTFVLNSGKKLRLPPAATPPHRLFEQELATRGLHTERHHFRVF